MQVIFHRILILALLVVVGRIEAQQQNICGTDEYNSLYHFEDEMESASTLLAYKDYMQSSKRSGSLVMIPVVFHVIHNNGQENISDATVSQALNSLNDAFSNLNEFYDAKGVNTNIQFCLAKRDESGKAFSGVNRVVTQYTDMSLFEGWNFVRDIQFDPDQYLNIQIVKEACLGSNCIPAGFFGGNRVVVESKFVDHSILQNPTLIHEVGHALGLKHTWNDGCNNRDCLIDGDMVCDTPPDNITFDHCNKESNSCSSDEDDHSDNNPFRPISLGGIGDQPDDHSNYMDYNFSECRMHFSNGQSERMHFVIQEKYSLLLNSQVCLPPCETFVKANFNIVDTDLELGETLQVINESSNADSYEWSINGEVVSTNEDLSWAITEEGSWTITLEAYTNGTLCINDMHEQVIEVVCSIDACLQSEVDANYLHLSNCSSNYTDSKWEVYNNSNELIYSTSQNEDSLYVNNLSFVRVCLTSSNEYCQRSECEFVTIQNNGQEICDNEEDDDNDGLIDLFDPDCACSVEAYQAFCLDECVHRSSSPSIKMKKKWESEVVESALTISAKFKLVSLSDDSVAVVANSVFDEWSMLNGTTTFSKELVVINASNGKIDNRIDIDTLGYIRHFATHRLRKDRTSRIYYNQNGSLNCVDSDLNSLYRTEFINTETNSPIYITDFNQDGTEEILVDSKIFSAETGAHLLTIPRIACNFGLFSCSAIPAVADFTSSPGLEIAGGNTILSIEINNNFGLSGNSYDELTFDQIPMQGYTSYSDVDLDGHLDVIVVGSNDNPDGGGILIWNPHYNKLISYNPGGWRGGVAFCGDVDGDCYPEIGMTFRDELRVYKFNGTTSLDNLWTIEVDDGSGRTCATLFDFDQDGLNEIVYRDESTLKILNGVNGSVIDIISGVLSSTGTEMPIIADIDNDGQAEILVTGHESDKSMSRILCFESDSEPWAPARSVWNQYAYNPTQINDDHTIPRIPQNSAIPLQGVEHCPNESCPTPYNNFMTQATYRTQEGCYVWPSIETDLTIDATSKCVGDSLEICFYVSATDTITLPSGVIVSCYPPPWDEVTPGEAIDQVVITNDTTCILLPQFSDNDSILVVINDELGIYPFSLPNTDIQECDYTNNTVVLDLRSPDFTLDVINFDCQDDSLTFYLKVENLGQPLNSTCIGFGYFFEEPIYGESSLLTKSCIGVLILKISQKQFSIMIQ